MLRIIKSSIFDSPAQTLVNTVNTVGVMGKGVAKEFKARFPSMFTEYKILCDNGTLEPGVLHIWRGERWVLNFPTKINWKKPSHLAYIEAGLKTFVQHYEQMGIRSISFPPLGCGNGNLDWRDVQPLMLSYLKGLPIPIYIHDWQVGKEFRPEHNDLAAKLPPISFGEFVEDVRAAIQERDGKFQTLGRGNPYGAEIQPDGTLQVSTERKVRFGPELLVDAWVGLQVGLLTAQTFGDKTSQKAASYLLPILAELPYVNASAVQVDPKNPMQQTGLFLGSVQHRFDEYSVKHSKLGGACLSR